MKEVNKIWNNCRFRAKVDFRGTLHILDCSKNKPYKSVTNSVDWLVPTLKETYKTLQIDRVLLYGTDDIVSKYDDENNCFEFLNHKGVTNDSLLVDSIYAVKMQEMYGEIG